MSKPTFTLHSPETGTDYALYVDKPAQLTTADSWPVMLVLDGDDQFVEAVKAQRKLVQAGTATPKLLVGIGYGASYTQPANRRVRDYTPVRAHDEESSGSAGKFLQFITDTLWPELERRYPVQGDTRGIAGYSLGALFVLHALFQEKPFFTHHLAGSPSIWWGDRAILRQANALHAAQPVLPGKLFFSVGEKDSLSMTGDVARLESLLASLTFRELTTTVRRFPKKHHFNAIGITFENGLATLYGAR